jgi:hypothetical protein
VPHPLQLQFAAGSAPASILTLSDPPPSVKAFGLSIPNPSSVRITLLATDPGSVSGSCAETAFIFDHKS